MRFSILVIVGLLISGPSMADYLVAGPITGMDCFLGISCTQPQIDAVKGDDGQMYSVKKQYSDVSEYNKSKGRCWINTKSKGLGLLSRGINLFRGSNFYKRKSDGSYEKVDTEYITFKCVER